eukprot:1316818-Amphidinium_carterae.1
MCAHLTCSSRAVTDFGICCTSRAEHQEKHRCCNPGDSALDMELTKTGIQHTILTRVFDL